MSVEYGEQPGPFPRVRCGRELWVWTAWFTAQPASKVPYVRPTQLLFKVGRHANSQHSIWNRDVRDKSVVTREYLVFWAPALLRLSSVPPTAHYCSCAALPFDPNRRARLFLPRVLTTRQKE